MYSTKTPTESNPAIHASEDWGYSDLWEENENGERIDTDNWLLGYVDMLTLMLTLLVMLLAFNHIEAIHPEFVQSKHSREISRDAMQNEATASPLAEPGSLMSQVNPSETRDLRIGKQFLPISYRGNVESMIQAGYSIQADGSGFFANPSFRNRINNDFLAELDLSINSVAALNNDLGTTASQLTAIPIEKLAARDTEKGKASEFGKVNGISSFRRVISAQNLDGLVDVLETQNAVLMEMNEKILFETGDAELKPHGEALLDELVNLFHDQPGNIHVEGHTDNVPIATARFPSNWELSASRASSVARYLIDHGVDPDRLRAIGFADTKPRANNQTPEGRSKNRRVSLIIELDDPEVAQIP